MEQALTVHRSHFAFTITVHYIFPQLTWDPRFCWST